VWSGVVKKSVVWGMEFLESRPLHNFARLVQTSNSGPQATTGQALQMRQVHQNKEELWISGYSPESY
jgi:hypothetical protein